MAALIGGVHLKQLLAAFRAGRFFRHPGADGGAVGQFFHHFTDELKLGASTRRQQRIKRTTLGKALVDDPRERFNLRPAQIGLQESGFVNRRGFGQGDDEYAGGVRVPQPGQ